jgi:hypothetical protein
MKACTCINRSEALAGSDIDLQHAHGKGIISSCIGMYGFREIA